MDTTLKVTAPTSFYYTYIQLHLHVREISSPNEGQIIEIIMPIFNCGPNADTIK